MLQELGTLLSSAGSEVAKRSRGWLTDRVKEHTTTARDLEHHKLRITSATVTTTRYAELHAFRELFLRHRLAEKSDANKEFFQKWLCDPVVELGWTPSGGWTVAKIDTLHSDLEKVKV